MKLYTFVVAALVGLTGLSQGAIALSGTALTGFGTLAPVGTLVLLIVDSPSNNFAGSATPLSGDLIATSVRSLTIAEASITTGERFGGDLVLGRLAVTTAGAIPGGFTIDNVAAIQNQRFTLVFLPSLGLTSTNANVADGTTYGLISGSDWILPAVNGGEGFSFSATDAGAATTFFRVTVAAGVATNDTYTSSSGANLLIGVPEPSAALLGAIGSLGLLRRRRN